MKHTDYSSLKNHFDWQTIPVNEGSPLCKIAIEYIKENYPGYREYTHACIFYEKHTHVILSGAPCDEPVSYNERFQFYLRQLPSLCLEDVAFMLNIVLLDAHPVERMFQWPPNYPSPFCKDYLKDTYGYVIYNCQFMDLVQFSLPFGGTPLVVNEYRRKYNMGMKEVHEQLEKRYLPDGYNLGKFLRAHTIKTIYGSPDYGYVNAPMHDIAYHFIACVQKYL